MGYYWMGVSVLGHHSLPRKHVVDEPLMKKYVNFIINQLRTMRCVLRDHAYIFTILYDEYIDTRQQYPGLMKLECARCQTVQYNEIELDDDNYPDGFL